MQFAGRLTAGASYLEVPPDVTTGWVVVVVGGDVVVVVGGLVVGVVVIGAEPDPLGVVVVVVGGLVVVVVDVVAAVVGTLVGLGGFEPADEPGCSLATVTPIKAVAPPATRMAVRVRRLMRACARARVVGENCSRPRLTRIRNRVARAPAHVYTSCSRRTPAYGSNLKNG